MTAPAFGGPPEGLLPGTLEVIAATPAVLRTLLGALPPGIEGGIEHRHAPGEWSIRDAVAHLVDRQGIQRGRIDRLLAEADPPIQNSDEVAELEASGLRQQDLGWLLDHFEAARRDDLALFRTLTPEQLARSGQHSAVGPITIAHLLHQMAHHDLTHLQQIEALLAAHLHPGRGPLGVF